MFPFILLDITYPISQPYLPTLLNIIVPYITSNGTSKMNIGTTSHPMQTTSLPMSPNGWITPIVTLSGRIVFEIHTMPWMPDSLNHSNSDMVDTWVVETKKILSHNISHGATYVA